MIVLDNLLHHHVIVYQLRKIAGREQDIPIGDVALLLHIPDPPLEQLILFRLRRLRLSQFLRLLLNQLAVHGDLIVDIADLLLNHVDLLL